MPSASSQSTETRALPLNAQNLKSIGQRVAVPAYDRSKIGLGIAHMGVGGFHRAHQAVYLDDLFAQKVENWGICGIGILDADTLMRDTLRKQDFLYTVVDRNAERDSARVIGSIRNMLLGTEDTEAVLCQMASPEIRIISLTVTEKGYCHDPMTGKLNEKHPLIVHDLENSSSPKSCIGYLVETLDRHRKNGTPPPTIMSCDNLMGNGKVTQDALLTFAELRDPRLAGWIKQNVAFPNSMVDRITPVTSQDYKEMIRGKFGIEDDWPIVCETFQQWMIEDQFPQGRPAWEKVGAQMLSDVQPYEHMKVRLLNGGHSALAYLSYLIGFKEVHEACLDPQIAQFLRQLMDDEMTPTLEPVPGVDLDEYKDSLITRFSNPAIRDQVQRLAMDGSQKLPNNLVTCARIQLEHGRPVKLLALSLAGWVRYLEGVDENGDEIEITDPMAEQLIQCARVKKGDPSAILALREIFGDDLSQSQTFAQEMKAALESLHQNGVRKTIDQYLRA